MGDPRFTSPVGAEVRGPNLTISDATESTKTKVVGDSYQKVTTGKATTKGEAIIFCTSPGEWTQFGGEAPNKMTTVDITHVRAVIKMAGSDAKNVLAKVCGLDFGEHMFPDGSAGRTSVAKTATEVVRADENGTPTYYLVTSRSFGEYLHNVLVDQAAEFLTTAQ